MPDNINSLDGSSKNESLECINGYSYDSDKYSSFVSEWDLVCDKAGLAELTQTLYAVGGVVGSLSMPYLSDTRGRKPTLVLCGILSLIFSIGSSFSPNYIVFAVLRGIEGIFIQGVSVACVTIMLEHFTVSSKTLMCGLTGVVWGLCVVPFGPVAYLLRSYNWRINNIIFSSSNAVVLFQFWFLEESLRWVVTNGFVERSKKIIKKAAKYNGVDFDRIWENIMKSSLIPLMSSGNSKGTPSKEDLTQQAEIKEEGFHTIFKDPLARRITIILFFIGCSTFLGYLEQYSVLDPLPVFFF
ncbi:solute carrier family 22 member 7-like [Octopus sinensis]|uniref:Solute carrier family 22 member 7-like n=1 Tax=Octopus sinensis TaxID=2607531 RepID=A0A6P7U8S6_9MOLL|nr:solute carrier family 22 member 7-like [Octopus sinensis]